MTTVMNDVNTTNEQLSRTQVLGVLGGILLVMCIALAGYLHAENMTRFPYYQDTEGTNLANAWSWKETGDLTPYTYSYDEAPTGTFILGIWGLLNGTFTSFGFPINSGRILMMVFHLMSVGFIFGITKSISKSNSAAMIAALLFAFSPLATSIQRRVLLDNAMLPFLLASIFFMVGEKRDLYHYMLSAFLFGTAVLIRGSAIYLLPGFFIVISTLSHPSHKRFAVNIWITLTICLISIFPLYAQMRQELFPEGWLFGGDFPHVSLIERIIDRGADTGVFLNLGGGLLYSFNEWTNIGNLTADPIIIYYGIISLIILGLLARFNKLFGAIVILVLSYLVGMIVGARVVTSDVIILLPLFAIAIGTTLSTISNAAGVGGSISKIALSTVTLVIMLYPFYIFYTARVHIYTMDQVSGQIEAVEWIENNLPLDSVIVTDNYAFVALRQTMPNVHHYWKVDTDTDIKFTLLEDNHCNIDYVLTTPQVNADINNFSLDLMRRAMEQSQKLLSFENEGWPVEIWQVSKQNCDLEEAVEDDLDNEQPLSEDSTPQSAPTTEPNEETNARQDPEIVVTPEQL
ncbi:MAG: glycosyltransferase family 39 protein [Phototrophicaceae bacterium]